MRVLTVILAIALGSTVALAQGDPRANYGPVIAAAAKSAAQAKAKRTARTSKRKGRTAAETTAKRTRESAPLPKPAARPKSAHEDRASTKRKAKSATTKSATNGKASTPDPTLPGLREIYAAMPLADRVALQSDLSWGGDFDGPLDGVFSEKLVEAVKTYQKRHRAPATGLLTAEQRSALAAAVEPREQEVGWRLMDDAATDARVGIPTSFATQTVPLGNGTRWSSEQGQLQIETFRIDSGASLEAVFEQQKKMARRRISSSSLQSDSFLISGTQGLKKVVVRGYARDGRVRGLSILYDQAMEGSIDPLIAPMLSAFVPFAQLPATGAAETPHQKVEYGTGVFVSAAGHLLTDRQLVEGCSVIALPEIGNAERVAVDRSGQLALLRVYGARHVTPIGTVGLPAVSADLTLVGIADPKAQGGGDQVSTVKAHLGAGTGTRPLDAAPTLGFAGAAALDAQGRFIGMVTLKHSLVAGPADAPQAAVVPLEAIRDFLSSNDVTPLLEPASIEAAKDAVVRVICVRK